MTWLRPRGLLLVAILAVLAVGAAAAFLVSDDDADVSTRTDRAARSPEVDLSGQRPASSPEEAVTRLLEAEQQGDHAASFRLLSSAGLEQHPDDASWTRRRTEVPEVTGFEIEGSDDDIVTALVRHDPGLDPFVGLRTAQERQRWRVREEAGGWLVDPEPTIEYLLPPDERARESAQRWVRALQDCDQKAAEAEQVDPDLIGISGNAAQICGTEAEIELSRAREVEAGFSTADLVGQYGEDALVWARAVDARAGAFEFSVILAPIGDAWRVVSVVDA